MQGLQPTGIALECIPIALQAIPHRQQTIPHRQQAIPHHQQAIPRHQQAMRNALKPVSVELLAIARDVVGSRDWFQGVFQALMLSPIPVQAIANVPVVIHDCDVHDADHDLGFVTDALPNPYRLQGR